MIFFFALLVTFAAANVVWWRVVDRRVRNWGARRGGGGESGGWAVAWRLVVAVLVVGMLGYVAGIGVMGAGRWLPMPVHVFAYLWNLMVLPGTLVALAMFEGVTSLKGLRNRDEKKAAQSESGLSRRRVLGMAVASVPPMVALGLTGAAEAELGTFRIRNLSLAVAGLPADLDGITIAHVTDVHIGRFLPAGTTGRIVEAVRGLNADLVVFTGDALDASEPRVEPAIEFLRALRPGGQWGEAYAIVEGNHDVNHGAERFESALAGAGLPLLLDSSKVVRLPGRATPIWLGGITWGTLVPGHAVGLFGEAARRTMRRNDPAAMAESVATVARQRAQGTFPILLVHHPHAFDPAAAHGFPLVLAGHTHGGQIMLTQNIGAGPLRFRYWNGIHRRANTVLSISNGVGNWFPLRINAPTEILYITLQSAETAKEGATKYVSP